MKNLLLISYPFPPNVSAGAVRSERFARYLGEFGWTVNVISIKPRSDSYIDNKWLKKTKSHVSIHQTAILDPWLKLRQKNPEFVLFRILRSVLMKIFSFPDHMLLWVPFVVKYAIRLNKVSPFDIIYSTSPPHSSHLAGLILSKILKKPWVVDFRDPWTLNIDRQSKKGLERLLLKIESFLEKRVLNNASAIISNTKANQNNLIKVYREIVENKNYLISNSWEEFELRNLKSNKNKFIKIVHAGIFYPHFNPYGLLHALSSWKNRKPPGVSEFSGFKVILLGSNDPVTINTVKELNLEDIVEIRSWVGRHEVQQFMLDADLLWASLGVNIRSSTFIPSKLFEYMSAGGTIIGFFPPGEAEKLIKETGTGVVFTNDDPIPIIKFLHQFRNNVLMKNENIVIPKRNLEIINLYHAKETTNKLSKLLYEKLNSS